MNWISSKDKLPPFGVDVLINNENEISIGRCNIVWTTGNYPFTSNTHPNNDKELYWMPLPSTEIKKTDKTNSFSISSNPRDV